VCFLFLDPQNEIGLSISSSVVLCSFRIAINIIHDEGVFVDFSNQHAMRMRHIIIHDLFQFYGIFVPYVINGTIFD